MTAVLAAGLVGGVAAQSPSAPDVETRTPATSPERGAFDLRFAGGSGTAFIQAVTAASGYSNIVVSDRKALAALDVPAVTLEDVTLSTAMSVLAALRFRTADGLPRVVEVVWVPAGVTTDAASSKGGAPTPRAASGACVVRVSDAPSTTSPDATIIDLRRRGIQSPEETRTTIDAMTQLVTGGNASPTFRIMEHEGSGLVAIYGTPGERQLAEQVISLIGTRARGVDAQAAAPELAVNVAATTAPAMSAEAAQKLIDELPDLTKVDLATLSKAELQSFLGKLSKARQVPNLSEVQKERMRKDFNAVLAAVKAR
ncbi:MAG: hypothetical protein JNM94_05555 [Phycisphaerae bacterium]|nr:hypothetical protein [Phycisphaerae bacterium]